VIFISQIRRTPCRSSFTKGRASLDGVALVSAVDAPGTITLGSTSCSIVWLTSGNYVITTRAKHNRDHANSIGRSHGRLFLGAILAGRPSAGETL